jgi:RNA polymerase sigma factor for flagellar operon FliA
MPRVTDGARRLSADEVVKLWREYKTTGDARVRDRLVLTFSPMVKYIVYKKVREMPAHCEVEDFISCGLEALIRSIDRFDPEKGATLEQFAWTRIHGAVLDELRRSDWAPRSVRRMDREVGKVRERFASEHGRPPTRAELSDALGVESSELLDHEQALARAQVGSLNSPVNADDGVMIEQIDTLESDDGDCDPERSAMRDEAKARFREAFARLSERDRRVAVLLYVNELTLREIGEILGVTESRVCQIHGELTKRLRAHLGESEQLFTAFA